MAAKTDEVVEDPVIWIFFRETADDKVELWWEDDVEKVFTYSKPDFAIFHNIAQGLSICIKEEPKPSA